VRAAHARRHRGHRRLDHRGRGVELHPDPGLRLPDRAGHLRARLMAAVAAERARGVPVELTGVRKAYGGHVVLAGIDLRVAPGELSGGIRRRVASARALAIDPELILYDEPTADLDPILTEQIGQLIARIRTLRGSTQIIVTHNLPLARASDDRIAVLAEGRIA